MVTASATGAFLTTALEARFLAGRTAAFLETATVVAFLTARFFGGAGRVFSGAAGKAVSAGASVISGVSLMLNDFLMNPPMKGRTRLRQ